MSTLWRLLNHSPSDVDLPPLLISTSFTSNSYTVNFTDLTYLWSESLDRRAIIRRSLDEDTSIDPSEGADQMRVFLEKIQSGLSLGAKTSLVLQAFPPKDKRKVDGPPDLSLVVTAQLPKSLKALEWSMQLRAAPQSAFSSQFIIPVLRAQNARLKESSMLVEMLREKDHVIQKLFDKLEATGADLGQVFPGAAGKGGRWVSRKQAEERIRGLGVFNVEEWRTGMSKKEEEEAEVEDVTAVVKDVFGGESGSSWTKSSNPEVSTDLGKWWDRILQNGVDLGVRDGLEEEQRKEHKTALNKSKYSHEAQEEEEEEDDDFQIQATPPRKGKSPARETDTASSPPTLRSQQVIDGSTEEDDDLDGPSQGSTILDSYQPLRKPQPKKIGAIGRSKPIVKPASPSVTKDNYRSAATKEIEDHSMADDDETASEDDEEPLPPSRKHLTPPRRTAPPPPETPKKGSLGRIGGPKKQQETPPLRPPTPTETHLPDHKPKHKLGVIGHRATIAPAPDVQENGAERGRASTAEEGEEPAPRETSKERADRKRAELKRELELKANAPVKKRRRF